MEKQGKKRWLFLLMVLFMVIMPQKALATSQSNKWIWPTYVHTLKNDWPNYASGSYHGGTDFPVPLNTDVYSSCDGDVVSVQYLTTSYGKHIKIKAKVNGEDVYIRYCHLNEILVSEGQHVTAGQIIGKSGSTGNSTGPHLHYEVRNSADSYKNALNPKIYLPGTVYTYETEDTVLPITETPSLWKSNDTCVVGDCVKFNWNSVENATGYWFSIWYKGEQVVTTQVSGNSDYMLYNLQEGEYTAFIKAYNETNSKENSVSLNVRYSTGEKTIANGKYQICSAIDNASVVSVASASQADEANVLLYANEYHTNQIFEFEYLENGYYKITAVHSGKCLDVYNNENKSGANVQQYRWDNNSNQNWIVREAGDGYFYIISKGNGLYLDVYGGEAHNDANIDTYSGHGGSSEKWSLIPWIEGKNEIEDGIYTIQSVLDSNYKLNVAGKSKQDEANIQLGRENDAYRIKYQKDGSYIITNVNSGKNLDAYSSDAMKGKKKGTNVQQFYANGESNQKWIIRRGGDNWYYVICKSNGLYLDVYGGNASNGANIDLWVDDGHTCQKWCFVSASKEISQCKCSLSEEAYNYDKNEKKPYVTVRDGDNVLTEGVDYSVTYSNNTNAGTATATVNGIGKYTGTLTKHFIINKASQELVISVEKTTLSIGESLQMNVSGQGNIGYRSDAEDIVSISDTGLLTAKQAGTAVITVTAEGTVNYNVAEKKISINVLKNCLNGKHSWNDGTITIQPTCGKAGEKLYTCTICQATKKEEIPATGNHVNTEVRNAKKATCTEEGYTGNTYCKDCGIKLSVGKTILGLGHEWDKGKVTKAVTCTEVGIKTYMCARCNQTRTEEIPATGKHVNTEVRNLKEATCEQEGYTGDTYCKDCNTKLSSGKSIAKKAHTWDEGKITKGATCSAEGVKTYTCTVCKRTRTEKIVATGHRNTEYRNSKAATCAEAGYTGDLYCKDCGIKLSSGKLVTKKEHVWDEGIITKEASCSAEGVKTYTCTVCKMTRTESIAATGHRNTEYRNSKEATCVEEGYTGDLYCKDCNTLISKGEVINKKSHTWDKGAITTAATCTAKGIRTYTCAVCKTTKTEELSATGHQHTELRNVKSATCVQEGYTGDTFCKDCNTKLSSGKSIAKKAHTWDAEKITQKATCIEKGVKTFTCTVCQATKTEEIPATGHGKTEVRNQKDATCKAEGYTGDSYCTVCNQKICAGKKIAKTAHSWDKGKITRQPTTAKTGIKTYTCTKCKTTRTETIAKLKVKKLAVGKIIKDKASNGVYKVLKGGLSVEFTKPITKKASVKIPDTIKAGGVTCKVTGISANAFKSNSSLKTISIGKNVTTIGNNAFYGCKKLNKITGGNSIAKIGEKAFANCGSLSSVTIARSVRSIGKQAFYNCKKLKSIVVKTVALTDKNIGAKAFSGTYVKPTVKVPAKQLKAYQKLLRSKGMSLKAKYVRFQISAFYKASGNYF